VLRWLNRIEFPFTEPTTYHETFVRLYAFADVYDTAQLRKDVMTLLVELTLFNSYNKGNADSWTHVSLIQELHDAMPTTSAIYVFAITRAALHDDFNTMTSTLALDELPLPHESLINMMRMSHPLEFDRRSMIEGTLRNSCLFYLHEDPQDDDACKKRHLRNGAFYTSFQRACKSEVYGIEHEEAEAELKAENEALQRKAEKDAEIAAEKKAKINAEKKAKFIADRKAKAKAEKKAVTEAEKRAAIEAENMVKAEAESMAKAETESMAKAEAEHMAKNAPKSTAKDALESTA
jgi:hypothetical protein